MDSGSVIACVVGGRLCCWVDGGGATVPPLVSVTTDGVAVGTALLGGCAGFVVAVGKISVVTGSEVLVDAGAIGADVGADGGTVRIGTVVGDGGTVGFGIIVEDGGTDVGAGGIDVGAGGTDVGTRVDVLVGGLGCSVGAACVVVVGSGIDVSVGCAVFVLLGTAVGCTVAVERDGVVGNAAVAVEVG